MNLSDVLSKVNKEFKKELAIKGIGDIKINRIPFTSPRLNYETYGGNCTGTGLRQTGDRAHPEPGSGDKA